MRVTLSVAGKLGDRGAQQRLAIAEIAAEPRRKASGYASCLRSIEMAMVPVADCTGASGLVDGHR